MTSVKVIYGEDGQGTPYIDIKVESIDGTEQNIVITKGYQASARADITKISADPRSIEAGELLNDLMDAGLHDVREWFGLCLILMKVDLH